MSFFKNLGINSILELHDRAVAGATNLAPNLAIQAEIDTYTETLDKLIQLRAKARQDLAKDEQELATLGATLDQQKTAGGRLLARRQATTDAAAQEDIKQAMVELTKMVGDTQTKVTAATARRDQSKKYCDELDKTVQEKSDALGALRQKLSDVLRESAQLQQDHERAVERTRDQKAAAGLSRPQAGGALDILKARNERQRADNAALVDQADVYHGMAQGQQPSGVLAEALNPAAEQEDPEVALKKAMGIS